MTVNRKIPIGSPVIIDTIKSKYNFNNKLTREIALMPEGIITGYADENSGEFLIVKLRSDIEVKITSSELSDCTKKFYLNEESFFSELRCKIKDFLKISNITSGNKKIKYVLNPVNFLKWLNFTIKDVF